MNDAPTPLQALVALVAVCDTSLDRRPQMQRAIADAHTAILAPRPAAAALMQSIELGAPIESDDNCVVSFSEAMRCMAPPEIAAMFKRGGLEA